MEKGGVILGIRFCDCRATAATFPTPAENTSVMIDGQSSIGTLSFSAGICPDCMIMGSFVTIEYVDNNVAANSFTFASDTDGVGLPVCSPTSFTVTLTGVATGANFSGPATIEIFTVSETGTFEITNLMANGHSFSTDGLASGAVAGIGPC
jgi:hypothetical protein